MLCVYLEDRNPPRVYDSIGIDLDVVLESRQHLGASGHPHRSRIPLAHQFLELGTEPWREPNVFGDSRVSSHCGSALESISTNELGVPGFLADVSKPRNQQS